jgi:hypothetical protein
LPLQQGKAGANSTHCIKWEKIKMLDIYNKEFWRGVTLGSTITLKDKQAIEDSMERGNGMKGMDYMVKTVCRLKELNGLAEWNLFLLDDPEDIIWVMVKMVEQEMDFRIYFEHSQFEPGNRRDMMEQENLWLFNAPDNPDDFQYNDLKFADLIRIDGDNDDLLDYKQKGFKEMHCSCEIQPALPGIKNPVATLVEYQTKEVCENPELLLFELGDSEDGGLIRLMPGCNLGATEIDVLEA